MDILLTNRKIVTIDIVDEYLCNYSWYEISGYAYTKINGKNISMHSIIVAYAGDKLLIDHKNRNKLDNRRKNLRIVTRAENVANSKMYSNNTAGYRGVTYDKINKKWKAAIKINYNLQHLGRYDTSIEAAVNYDIAAIQVFGNHISLNVL